MAKYREKTYVAVKILVASEANGEMQEVQIMQKLACQQPCPKHMVHLLDRFKIESPNGCHKCLVFELLGLNVPDTIDEQFPSGRLSGKFAKAIAKQSLAGLDVLHQNSIGHGGMPPSRNNLDVSHPRKIFIPAI